MSCILAHQAAATAPQGQSPFLSLSRHHLLTRGQVFMDYNLIPVTVSFCMRPEEAAH